MPHNISLISTIAMGFGMAVVLGFLAVRVKLPALVGYLLAGILIGPATPGVVADSDMATQLAEIGVMLLMFGVGLHFSLQDLLSVRKIAIPGAIAQIAAATLMGMGMAHWWGWDLGGAIVFGLALSVASTVVLLKALESKGITDSMDGRIAIGWLIVEDLVMVLVLVLLPALASLQGGVDGKDMGSLGMTIGRTLLEVTAFVALMLVVGRRLMPWLLWQVTKTGSRELFTLCVVAAAVTIAYGSSKLFGVSFALGAFFAGMVLRESEFSHRAAEETLPLRDAFSVLFFVSVGMLFDPRILIEQPFRVLGVLAVILIGKSIAAAAVVLIFRYPLHTALTISASLAQVGEFSFILAALGVSLKLLPVEGQSLIVAGALISIALNPMLFSTIEPLLRAIRSRFAWARELDARPDPYATLPETTDVAQLSGHVVIVGYGRVGRRLAEALREQNVPLVVAEQNRERVEALRKDGFSAVAGDATEDGVLIQAHIARAKMIVIATPDTVGVRRMIETAKKLNPTIRPVVRMHSETEARLMKSEGLGEVFLGEQELAEAMIRHVLSQADRPGAPLSDSIQRVVLNEKSPAIGQSLRNLRLREQTGASVIGIYRHGALNVNPPPDTQLLAHDVLVLIGHTEACTSAQRFLSGE